MALYKHGVYASEQPTSMVAPISGTAGLQVVIGTAPVNMLKNPAEAVNKPKLVTTYAEAVAAVGFNPDFMSYTICESISASFQVVGVAPMVIINVLDPEKHKADMAETVIQVNGGKAVLEVAGVLLNKMVVKAEEVTLTAGEDYTTAWNNDGTLNTHIYTVRNLFANFKNFIKIKTYALFTGKNFTAEFQKHTLINRFHFKHPNFIILLILFYIISELMSITNTRNLKKFINK